MLLDLIDKKIRSAFSDAALEYDLLSSLHKEIGRELMKKVIEKDRNDSVLDVGMGTGWLTKKIKFYLPESTIVGIDFAEGMLQAAQEAESDLGLIQANASCLPFKEGSFDLVVSNLSLQWVKTLKTCFGEIHHALKNEGELMLTMFAQATFHELFEALNAASWEKHGCDFKIERLKTRDEIRQALKDAGFGDIQLDYEIIKVHFADMFRLIRWIKDIGANTLPRHVFVGKDLLAAASRHYEKFHKDKFGITTTFEVIWASARK